MILALVVGCALLSGLFCLFWIRCYLPVDDALAKPSEQLTETAAQLDAQLNLLRDLREQASFIHQASFQNMTAEAELQAAAILQQHKLHRAAAQVQPRLLLPVASSTMRGFFYGIGVGLLGSVLGLLLYWSSQIQKPSIAPSPPAASAFAKEIALARAAVAEHPHDPNLLVKLAHHLLRAQAHQEAQEVNNTVLQLDPNNVEAAVHRLVLQAASGQTAPAVHGLDAFLANHQDYAEAWFFRGMLALQAQDMPTVQHSFEQFVRYAADGPQRQRIQHILQQMSPPVKP